MFWTGRIALVLAVLIRHATLLRAELAKAGLLACLVSLATEENATIRRLGAAGLGELLFYISTNSSDSSWAIPAAAMTQLLRCLREGEQDAVRLCALRTYENVLCCARPQWVQRFATREVAMMLLQCMVKKFSDEMQGAAAMALFHLVRANRRMLPKLAEQKVRQLIRHFSRLVLRHDLCTSGMDVSDRWNHFWLAKGEAGSSEYPQSRADLACE